MGDSFKVFFVKCDNNGENESSMVEAFELLRKGEQNLDMDWISQDDCLSVEICGKPSHNIFIFNTFEGEVFNHVQNLKCRVYGPQCLISNLQHGMDLPKDAKHPIFTMAMRGIKVCCTSIDKTVRNEIQRLVHLMAGEMAKDLTSDITHLIAGEVGSEKYMVAQSAGKVIMMKDWVYKVWESAQSKHILGTDEIFDKYRCPLFLGLTVCVSGFNQIERNQMKNFVIKGGGKYSGELKMNECTHLIVKEPKGAKYEAAKKWKIKTVKDRWLFDSIDKGKYLDPKLYNLEKGVKTSTPERLSGAIPCINDVSVISADSRESTFQQINETDMLSSRTSLMLNLTNRLAESRNETTCVETNSTVTPADIFLDGCRIFLSGLEYFIQEKLRKIITSCGGFRATEIEPGVTHVIVGQVIQPDIEAANKLIERPFFLRRDWLMDSYHKNSHLNEKAYLVNVFDFEEKQTSEQSTATSKLDKGQDEASQMKDETSLKGDEAASDLQMAELLSQYVPEDNEILADDQTLVNKNDPSEVEENKEEKSVNVELAPPEDEMTQDPNDLLVGDCEGESGIFNHKVFILLGIPEEAKENLTEHIESSGGRVINLNQTRHVADIAIVPLTGYPVSVTVPEVLTDVWLQMCLEREELVPVNHWLAKPIEIPEGEPLSGCCISVSGFSGAEKEFMVHIIKFLGADFQIHFARRTSKKVKACSHLIVCVPEGTKYTAAKQWGIPALGKEWLVSCMRSGQKPPEDEFDIEFICNKNEEEEEEKEEETRENLSMNTSATEKPDEPQDNTDGHIDAQDAQVEEDAANRNSGDRTHIGEKSMSMTPCYKEPVERVQSSSKENSQGSSETDLNPLREVNRHLRSTDPNTSRLSLNTNDNDGGLKQMSENEVLLVSHSRTPANSRVKDLINQANSKSSSSTPPGLVKGGGESPGTFTHPDYRAKFNFSGMFSPMTPDDARDLNKSTPLGEVFSRQIEKAARNVLNDKELTPHQSQPECVGPLYGVVIAVAKKLGKNHVEYNKLVVELGGHYTWQYNNSATHFVFQGRPNDTNKEFRKARDDGKFIVSPYWLHMCKEQHCRVDESLFPHHYNPNQALVLATESETPVRSRRLATRNKGSKGETPLKIGKGKTPGRKRPVLNLEMFGSKEVSPGKAQDVETRLQTADENVNKNCDKVAKSARSGTMEKPDDDASLPGPPQEALTHLEEVAVTTPDVNSKEDTTGVSDQATDAKKCDDKTTAQEMKEALSKTLGTVLAEASSRSRKSSRKKGKRLNLGVQRNSSSGNTPESTLTRSSAAGWGSKDAMKDSNSMPEPSQSLQVTWDDPTERLEKEKLAHRLERVCDPSQNTDDCLAAMDLPGTTTDDHQPKPSEAISHKEIYRSPTPEAPSIAFPVARPASTVISPQPVELISDESCDSRIGHAGSSLKKLPAFMMSGLQNEERVEYGALVEQLGGKMSDKQHFDPSCTHLITTQPVRNEKYLSSVAAGNWVLHKSYFEACRKEGKLVKEENHEWGSEFTLSLMQNMTTQAFKLAAAAHKWRKKVASMKKSNPACRGAFHGWKVVLCLDRSKEQNFQRLLEAGGATVQILKPPFSQSLKATHAFLDLNKVTIPQEDLETMITLNVHCLKAEYIAAYLTDDPQPDPKDFYPPAVAALKVCMPDEGGSRKRKASFGRDDSVVNQAGKIARPR